MAMTMSQTIFVDWYILDDEREREEREQKEREKEQRRKRRRRDSDSSSAGLAAIHCHHCTPGGLHTAISNSSTPKMVFPTSPLMGFNLRRDDAVGEYSLWQQSQVTTEEQKEHYSTALELTLAYCFDLDMLASNQERMYQFYKKHGIPEGVAWRYVCDIKSFLKQHERAKST